MSDDLTPMHFVDSIFKQTTMSDEIRDKREEILSKHYGIEKSERSGILFKGDETIYKAMEEYATWKLGQAKEQSLPESVFGKYSWGNLGDKKFCVWHTENDIKTFIASTDNAEKAHFLATAANQFNLEKYESKPLRWVKELPEVMALDAEINGLVNNTRVYSPKVLQNYFWKAVDAIQKGESPQTKGSTDVLKNIQHHIDMWPDEPERAIRLIQKELSTSATAQGGSDEWINVHDNSDGFRDYLDSKGIEYKVNGHFTMVKKEVDLYWLGRDCEQWKQENSPQKGRNRLFE